MRTVLAVCMCAGAVSFVKAASAPDDAVRAKLAQAILAAGDGEQANLLNQLGETGSPLVRDVLSAWTRDSVYLWPATNGTKVPVQLEDQEDADGKARAIRIADGQILKDDKGADLRFDASDLTSADTDAPLRKLIQQTLDSLALTDADPDTRRTAVVKLGNSGKLSYIPIPGRSPSEQGDQSRGAKGDSRSNCVAAIGRPGLPAF